MDFITGLPKRKEQNDSIFIVIDKLSKAALILASFRIATAITYSGMEVGGYQYGYYYWLIKKQEEK